ncbi:BrnA antitoxin family protein (plasmid) [Cereibacter azotoformans]|uniref:BrnA antitoxin family protein n=1 Tax=Cereibacter azotoformans TaxID=43057 RepID=UPI003B20E510
MKKGFIDDDGEVSELTDAFFRNATRGRPPMPPEQRKQRVNVMLDPDVVARLKEGGKGWQTRLNATLREALGLPR